MIATRIAGLALALLAGAGLMWGYQHHASASTAAHAEAAGILPGPVDIGFAQFMGEHHDQAVVMAQIMSSHGSTKLVGLVRTIQTAQLVEIGEMRGWLLLWGKPLLPSTNSMDWMLLGKTPPDAALSRYLLDCKSAAGGMPGLASSDELNRLRSLDGDERDRLFLELMIRHHQGALPMAYFASRNAEAPAVRILAAQMVAQQSEELSTMALALRARQQ